MRKGRLDNDLVGIAGVHYIAFELSRRGLVVLPATRNTRGYDMVAIRRTVEKSLGNLEALES